jgi:hypothetical protein
MPQGQSHEDDLKRREYRDEDGNIHHHTRPYMERHAGEGGAGGAKGGRSSQAKPRSRRSGGGAETTIDHDEIRTWAETHGGRPAAVKRTHKGGDVGIVRIMFPDAPNADDAALTEIGWDEFFAEFEDRKLALLYEPDKLFNKIIGRDTAEKRARGDNKAAR